MKKLKAQITKLRIAIALLFIVLIAVVIVSQNSSNKQVSLPELATTTAQIRDVKQVISVDGNLRGVESRKVFFPTNSVVSGISVDLGDQVKKNSQLAKVRVSDAFGNKTTRNIKSPIAGTVVAINYSKGDLANPSTPGILLVDESSYLIELHINENDIVDVKKAQTATIIIPAISLDEKFAGEVTQIEPAPISLSGAINYNTTITPEELPDKVKLGMSAIVDILAAQSEDVLAIPDSFIIERGEKLLVKAVTYPDPDSEEYQIVEVEIEVGLRTSEFVEVKSGLVEGDLLVEPSFVDQRSFSLFGN